MSVTRGNAFRQDGIGDGRDDDDDDDGGGRDDALWCANRGWK